MSNNKTYIAKAENFSNLTLELLRHKYKYYVLNQPTISDYDYDMLERRWTEIGEALGLDMTNYQHWVGFDSRHPLAPIVLQERAMCNKKDRK